ncbi:MAG: hypothetical protein A2754_00820 [Candidatus Magasanikbacteria bacterium RIFCSPHIGHO2_01_FULL_47_8]|uniref:Phospho-N-acetylmuramoyl-pentapeptide-transferase n=1 Tax=Candidatus Magasanikbacteria bacterium RIFCSPHIGHO2_01_FULL_47_8 TaxID=1798673 RepID=A0A1F6MCX3_9BACT|nr:MAG: hypothetical protein A2754_00820 [Candidatus Magasanikbacteria bacterium RIFCSPHIGHO2_01_FULL_47_8]
MNLELLQQSLVYLIASTVGAFLWAPILTKLLYKYNITRRADFDFTLRGDRQHKVGTPIMGGLLVVITVTVVTMLFNWERRYTYVPIGAMGIAAVLGAADDLLIVWRQTPPPPSRPNYHPYQGSPQMVHEDLARPHPALGRFSPSRKHLGVSPWQRHAGARKTTPSIFGRRRHRLVGLYQTRTQLAHPLDSLRWIR